MGKISLHFYKVLCAGTASSLFGICRLYDDIWQDSRMFVIAGLWYSV
jgi:hypothetical protein